METILRMTLFDWMIFIFALIPYGPLIIGIVKNPKDKSQSFFTWILYSTIDAITMFSSKEEGSHSYALLFGYTVGSIITSIILLYQGRIKWGWLETITATLIIICIYIWKTDGTYYALIAGIISEIIVGLYLFYKTYKNPVIQYNLVSYIGFFIISFITMLTVQDWSLKEVGYPLSETILSFLTTLPLFWKLFYKKQIIYLLNCKYNVP